MKTPYLSDVNAMALPAANIRMTGAGSAAVFRSRATIGMTPISGTSALGTIIWQTDTVQPFTVIWECAARLGCEATYSEIIAR